MRVLAVSLVVSMWLGACASSGGGSAQRFAELEARVLELQRKAAMAEVEIDRLQRQVHQMTLAEDHRGEAGAGRGRDPEAPQPVEIVPPAPATEPLEAVDLEDDGGALGSAGDSAQTAATNSVPPAGQALYDQGYTLYHQGRTVDAEGYFQRFLLAYGASDLADNAQFWIGASRLARGDDQGAALAFREVIDRYPDGNKVPDALLKLGESLERQGDREGARRAWEEVVRRFPTSDAAIVAGARLR